MLTRTARSIILLSAALALGIGGCGGKSDKQQVENTVKDYFSALGSQDGKRACSLLTEDSQTYATTPAAQGLPADEAEPYDSCADALTYPPGDRDLEDFKQTTVNNVTITGETAQATVSNPRDGTDALVVRKVGDSWRIEVRASQAESQGP